MPSYDFKALLECFWEIKLLICEPKMSLFFKRFWSKGSIEKKMNISVQKSLKQNIKSKREQCVKEKRC